jgi:CDGSH-type Zn-finger protein
MSCKYCDGSHSAFDPCPESIAALEPKKETPNPPHSTGDSQP